jgi:hypothetical protein
MFTQQTPFLLSSMRSSMDSMTAQQLAQAFGNCNQPLSHRAGVSLRQSGLNTAGGVLQGPGGNPYDFTDGQFGFLAGNDPASQFSPWAFDRGNYYGGDQFNNNIQFAFRSGDQFLSSYPDAASNAFYNLTQSFEFGPISTVNNSPWYTRAGDINNFDFSTRLGDTVNNFGGPTFQVAGDSYYDNSVHNNQTVVNQEVINQTVDNSSITELNVTNITSGKGDPGPDGGVGPGGPPGAAGQPGRDGGIFFGGGVRGGYSLPVVNVVGTVRAPFQVKPDGLIRWPLRKDRLRLKATVKLPGVTFDEDTCTVAYDLEAEGPEIEVTFDRDSLLLPTPLFFGNDLPLITLGPDLIPKPNYP